MWCTRRKWSYFYNQQWRSTHGDLCPQCKSNSRPTGLLVNSGLFTAFSHKLLQKVLRHYNRNVMNIVVSATTNNWMANNARELYIWYNFEIVPCNRTKFQKRAEWCMYVRTHARMHVCLCMFVYVWNHATNCKYYQNGNSEYQFIFVDDKYSLSFYCNYTSADYM